jgi:hypothetical protein
MSCFFFAHEWVGCVCRKCGKSRKHIYGSKCECQRCGDPHPNRHIHLINEGHEIKSLRCRCERCGGYVHIWSGCKCSICGDTRNEDHTWVGCICTQCGATRNQEHTWEGCKCTRCGWIRNQEHTWEGCWCTRCGTTRDQDHQIQGCKCIHCDHEEHHYEYWKSEEHEGKDLVWAEVFDRCTRCGKIKTTDQIIG